MSSPKPSDWHTTNQHHLMHALTQVRYALQAEAARLADPSNPVIPDPPPDAFPGNDECQSRLDRKPPALEYLCQLFQLSDFEREILMLCAGQELDPSWAALCGAASGDARLSYPTFYLARTVFSDTHWSAFSPLSPLRRWQLVELGPGHSLLTTPLRIDERILHYLMGLEHLDERLMDLVKAVPPEAPDLLVPSHQSLVNALAASLAQHGSQSPSPVLQLCGEDHASKRMIAAQVCRQIGSSLYSLNSKAIPTNTTDLQQLIHLWEREARLKQVILLLDWDDVGGLDAARECAVALLVHSFDSSLIVLSRDRRSVQQRPLLTFDVHTPTLNEQAILWQQTLGDRANELNGFIESLSTQFNLSTNAIRVAGMQALAQTATDDSKQPPVGTQQSVSQPSISSLAQVLWHHCRLQSRPQLDDLVQRITTEDTWEDLVLPDLQKEILREISAHVRQRMTVYQRWGFARSGDRGLGISALFAGLSGTGKTMAAGVIARELDLDLYRIDLSAIVSKYIGETEKNLRRVFDAAETGGVVLLFDEADAIFGKRSDVKDSHDRYANMEVSYLLQRMESYRGLAILTTNLKESIDPAFIRRLRFIVRFPFPDMDQRVEIWRRAFPAATPTTSLNLKKLARLNISGGNIRNIALNAAFLAADEGSSVTMAHLLRAAQSEYAKIERTLTDAEVRGWVSS
ncbi:MAG: ATP-binding protein [Elainellaceae cyanobacterium]